MHRLAASFIVTVSMLPACGPGSGTMPVNPPEPVEVMRNPPPPDTAPPEPATVPVPAATAVPTTQPDAMPTPEAGDKIVTKADGTCWVYPNIDCPPSPVTCNPPPPRQVQCPASE
jgi:hypothetical protein